MKAKVKEEIIHTLSHFQFHSGHWEKEAGISCTQSSSPPRSSTQGSKRYNLDTQSAGSNVELSQMRLSNLGWPGYGTKKPRAELSINTRRGHNRKTEPGKGIREKTKITSIKCEIGKHNMFNRKCLESTLFPRACLFSHSIDWGQWMSQYME